jgi:hypothetical protein
VIRGGCRNSPFSVAPVASGPTAKSRPDGIARDAHGRYRHGLGVRGFRTTMQAHYTLAGSYSYGESTGNRSGAGHPQVWDEPFAENEWGPNGPDERHRFVLTGIFEAPYGVQPSPVVQWASARAYNLTAGTDLNTDGNNHDRWDRPSIAYARQVQVGARVLF